MASSSDLSRSPDTVTSEDGHPRRWAILAVLVLSLLIVVLDNTVLNVALRVIADPVRGLGATQSQLQWCINAYTLVFAGLLFSWGLAGDRLGRKRILLVGFTVFGIASLACSYAQSPGQLIAARALMGIGGAAVMPATLAVISNVFSPRERAKAVGVWAGAVGLAVAIGPIVGGILLDHFWWGSVFLINVPVVLVGMALIVVLVPESRDNRPAKFDPIGIALQITGLVLFIYGIIKAGDLGTFSDPQVLTTMLGGIAILVGFVLHELRTPQPALDVRLFRDRRFAAATTSIGLSFFAMMGVFFFMTFYLQIVRGYSPLGSGLLLLPFAVGQLVFSPLSARFVARFGAKAVSAVGMALVGTSFLAFLAVNTDTPIVVLELVFLLQGSGIANVMPPATEAIMASLPREKAGVGSAVNNTIRQVGGALGVAVLGTVLASVYRSRITPTLNELRLPSGAREIAAKSLSGTDAVITAAAGKADALREPAYQAFVGAMHTAAIGSAVVTLLGLIVVLVWMPGRPVAVPAEAESPMQPAVPGVIEAG
jgi:MFS transporter, DHA2 family, multidrug resistance protein